MLLFLHCTQVPGLGRSRHFYLEMEAQKMLIRTLGSEPFVFVTIEVEETLINGREVQWDLG